MAGWLYCLAGWATLAGFHNQQPHLMINGEQHEHAVLVRCPELEGICIHFCNFMKELQYIISRYSAISNLQLPEVGDVYRDRCRWE